MYPVSSNKSVSIADSSYSAIIGQCITKNIRTVYRNVTLLVLQNLCTDHDANLAVREGFKKRKLQ